MTIVRTPDWWNWPPSLWIYWKRLWSGLVLKVHFRSCGFLLSQPVRILLSSVVKVGELLWIKIESFLHTKFHFPHTLLILPQETVWSQGEWASAKVLSSAAFRLELYGWCWEHPHWGVQEAITRPDVSGIRRKGAALRARILYPFSHPQVYQPSAYFSLCGWHFCSSLSLRSSSSAHPPSVCPLGYHHLTVPSDSAIVVDWQKMPTFDSSLSPMILECCWMH